MDGLVMSFKNYIKSLFNFENAEQEKRRIEDAELIRRDQEREAIRREEENQERFQILKGVSYQRKSISMWKKRRIEYSIKRIIRK